MKNYLNIISLKLSLTAQEIKSGAFILIVLLLGLSVKFTNFKISENPKQKYHFNFFDSLNKVIQLEQQTLEYESKIVEKRVDSDLELSDFSVKKLDSNKKIAKILPESIININTSSVFDFAKLPGIGPKTAEKIVELRNSRKGFKKIDELMDVKGIGKKKFNKIINYLYIEK
ncbi:MAG: helix-hairpin-helix domain-containing protein [Ignavibacteriae bacterium]|nr:helix-hairpin-helix domain-containing protein [Ignavibacteriota bacterium]